LKHERTESLQAMEREFFDLTGISHRNQAA
jgi:hypothetical protein